MMGDKVAKLRQIKAVYVLLAVLLLLFSARLAWASETKESHSAIAFGEKGDEVLELQTRLKELGYYSKSLDGDYGNGTKTAVLSFQARNGLPQDGIATEETIEALFSDSALAAPPSPDLEITAISCDMTYGILNISVTNNLNSSVDSLSVRVLTFGAGGEISVENPILDTDNPGLVGDYTLQSSVLNSGGTAHYSLDVSPNLGYNVKVVGAYICKYHTTDGYDYEFSPDQVFVYKTDNSIEFPVDESEPDCLKDGELQMVDSTVFGVTNGAISKWLTKAYLLPEGERIFSVADGSIMDEAGIQVGDVLTAFDEIPLLGKHAWEHAKARMYEGKIVKVHFIRYGKEMTTEVAADMSIVQDNKEEPVGEGSESGNLTEELTKLTDLYEKELLTEEEYAAAKAELLGRTGATGE